jgi:hypothetical protein
MEQWVNLTVVKVRRIDSTGYWGSLVAEPNWGQRFPSFQYSILSSIPSFHSVFSR